jgi:hypothetical protein
VILQTPLKRNREAAKVKDVLSTRLSERARRLARACEMVNRSRAIRAIERDWDVLTDEILEPWDDTTVGEI